MLFFCALFKYEKNGEKNSVATIINTPFTQERRGTQHGEILYIVDGPFQLVHADMDNLEFQVNLRQLLNIAFFVLTYLLRKYIPTE